ncbi:hypothetical protein [Streptomyces sp. Ag109_G2-15]|uniref:hypothetical protein n=1 Tax=Streptomyces sp. Ag109_G2-15 TaxID=1938850 RepID=UPI000BE34A7D|nr:hypothetical protein [Streptomyces sp. Ag109_G2-15]
MGRDTTVLLPDYPLDDLRDALAALGFTRFRHLPNGEPVDLGGGLRAAITAVSAPVDGPIGDSALAVADGTACILDQNDARPLQAEQIAAFGPYDAHFLQFSSATWWPLAYDLPARAKAVYGRAARRNGLARAQRFVEQVGARHVVPNAGPACSLDDDLFDFNDLRGEDHNPFADQSVFVDHLHRNGHPEAVLTVPGTVLEFTRGRCEVRHPAPDAFTPFRDRRRTCGRTRPGPGHGSNRSAGPGDRPGHASMSSPPCGTGSSRCCGSPTGSARVSAGRCAAGTANRAVTASGSNGTWWSG